jgi:hypothetical protein
MIKSAGFPIGAKELTLHNWRTVKLLAICTTCQYGHGAAGMRLGVPKENPTGAVITDAQSARGGAAVRRATMLARPYSPCLPERHRVSPIGSAASHWTAPALGAPLGAIRRRSIGPKGNRQRAHTGRYPTARPGWLCHRPRTVSLMLPSPIGTMTRSSRSPRRSWNIGVAATQPRRGMRKMLSNRKARPYLVGKALQTPSFGSALGPRDVGLDGGRQERCRRPRLCRRAAIARLRSTPTTDAGALRSERLPDPRARSRTANRIMKEMGG